MELIYPFEPVRMDQIPLGKNWCYQVKWDGVRVLTYWEDGTCELYNRKKNKRTFTYPELTEIETYTDAHSIILDGEVIALDHDGMPSFHEVMRRDGIRSTQKVMMMKDIVPVTYMIFDILYLNGEWLATKPFNERQELLSSHVSPRENIQIVPSFEDGEALFRTIKSHQMEGIVAKRQDSAYGLNGKDARWIKVKNYLDIDAVIGGFTSSHQTANALLLGLFDESGALHYIGHVGPGKLTVKDWRGLSQLLISLETADRPFINKPKRVKDAHWVEPQYVAKVQFMEWTNGGTLRQPNVQALVDKEPSSCLFE